MDVCRLQIPSSDSQMKVLCQDLLLVISKNKHRERSQWLRHTCPECVSDTDRTPQQSSPSWQGVLPGTCKGASCQSLLQPAPAGSAGKTGPHQPFPVKPSLELAGVNKHQVCTLFRKDLNKGLSFLSSSDKQKTIPNFSIPTTEHNFL